LKPKTKRKNNGEENCNLAKLSLSDKLEWKLAKGYVYIKDVRIGELVETSSLMRAIVLDKSSVSTTVLVTSANHHPTKDKSFYLGKHRWGSTTEVKII